MTGITLSFSGTDLLTESAFLRLEAAVGSMDDVMNDIGRVLVRSARDRILVSNQAPDGTPWKQSKRAIQKGGKTLLDKRRLHASITQEAHSDSVDWGSNMVYSAVHQLGAAAGAFGIWEGVLKGGGKRTLSLPFGDIPARPYLGVSNEDRETISELVVSYFDDAVGGGS